MPFTLQTHKHAAARLRSEFVFHILSAGCVMTPVIKVGNCLTEVLRYWIRGQFCRRGRRRVDVKSLSGEIGSRAEQTHRRWYQHQREMLALCWLTLVNGIQSTCYPIPPPRLSLTLSSCLLEPDTSCDYSSLSRRGLQQIISIQRHRDKQLILSLVRLTTSADQYSQRKKMLIFLNLCLSQQIYLTHHFFSLTDFLRWVHCLTSSVNSALQSVCQICH